MSAYVDKGLGLRQVQMHIYESATSSIINVIDDETGYQKLPITYTDNTRDIRNSERNKCKNAFEM